MIEGKTVHMAGTDWTIPPLNFKALRRFREELGAMSPEALVNSGKVVEIIHAAMLRNYPDLTLEQLEDMLDMGNIMHVTEAVLAISGLVEKQPGEAPAASPSTGANSTGS
jgi:hypothetical protein